MKWNFHGKKRCGALRNAFVFKMMVGSRHFLWNVLKKDITFENAFLRGQPKHKIFLHGRHFVGLLFVFTSGATNANYATVSKI